jgi:hypothetical protein
MGTVYAAGHRLIEKDVALEVLSPQLAFDGQLVERFLLEARSASRIIHENVIEIFDLGRSVDGYPYMVMELLSKRDPGQTLAREGALPWPRLEHIAIQIGRAVCAAHEHGIVHRDLGVPAARLRGATEGGGPQLVGPASLAPQLLGAIGGAPLPNSLVQVSRTGSQTPGAAGGYPWTMSRPLWLVLLGAVGCGGESSLPVDASAPAPMDGGAPAPMDGGARAPMDGGAPALMASCPAMGTAVSVAGSTTPPLEEVARLAVSGFPWFAADEQAVYWVSYSVKAPGIGSNGPTTIEASSLVLGDSTGRQLWRQEMPGQRSLIGQLWSSGPELAWLEFFPSKPPTNGSLFKLPKAGGTATALLADVRVTDCNAGLLLLGTDEQRVYLSPISPVGITAMSRATGDTIFHITTTSAPTLLAIDGDHLYWIEADSLWRADHRGTRAELLASGLPKADALAVHDGVAWVALDRLATKRVARVEVREPSVMCAMLTPWPEGGREAQLRADASGAYLAIRDANGSSTDTVWRIAPDGGGMQRLLGPEPGRQVRLLRLGADGLLLALSGADGAWIIGRLPPVR